MIFVAMDGFDNEEIIWGKVTEGLYKENVSYLSFFYQGEEYELYDIVYLHDASVSEPHIGKIIVLWEEKESKKKRMLIQWFFRSRDLVSLGLDSNSRELFLAFGEGQGVTNENDVEVISGKCKVLCTSKDPRNAQPSENDLRDADFYFYRVYNVQRKRLSNVDGVAKQVGFNVVFNKQKWVSSVMEKSSPDKERDPPIATDRNRDASVPAATILTGSAQIKEDGPQVARTPKFSEGSETSKAVGNGQTDIEVKPSASIGKTTRQPSGSLPSGSKKRPRDLEIVAGAAKKRSDAAHFLKKGNESAGLKRPKVALEEDKDAKKLKVPQEAKLFTPKGVTAKPPGTSPKFVGNSINAVKQQEDIQSGQKSKITSLETEVNTVKIEKEGNQGPAEMKFQPPVASLKLPDGLIDITKTKDDIEDECITDTSKLKGHTQVDEKSKLPVLEGKRHTKLGDVTPKSPVSLHTVTEQSSKLPSLETERHTKASDVTPKSPITVHRVSESSPKLIKVPDESDSVSVVSDSLLIKPETEKRNADKDARSQESMTTQKPFSKVTKPISASREEGGPEGSSKGDSGKLNNTAKLPDLSGNRKEEAVTKIVEHKEKAVAGKLLKKVKPSLSTDGGKVQKYSEKVTTSKDVSDSFATKKVSFSKDTGIKLIEKTAFLKGKEDTGTDKNSTPTPFSEKRRIFKQLPWDENLAQGLPEGRVLFVSNLNPQFTSTDACDMLKCVFDGFSDARLIPQYSNALYGEALVIFDNKNCAESALRELEEKCLVITGSNRPLIARLAKPPESTKATRFPGHFPLEKFKLSRHLQSEEMRKAVSTSHCSQPNTIEFEMAMEWRQQQEITQKCWRDLYEKQNNEITEVFQKYKQRSR